MHLILNLKEKKKKKTWVPPWLLSQEGASKTQQILFCKQSGEGWEAGVQWYKQWNDNAFVFTV